MSGVSLVQGVSGMGADNVAITGGTINNAQIGPTNAGDGRVWAFLGDSITHGSTAGNFAWSFTPLACAYAGPFVARLDSLNAGTPGYTAASALAYFPTVIAQSPRPTALCLMIGMNDGPSTTLASYQASVASIIAQAKAQQMPIVICTVTPRSASVATATTRAFTKKANTWLRLWAGLQGCLIADTYAALVDPATGDMLAAYDSGDGVHPNTAGHQKMAQVVATAMVSAVKNSASGFTFASDTFGLISNPLMNGGGSQATNWFEQPGGTGTAPTYSIVADTTGRLPAGRWQQMDFDATASGGSRTFAIAPSFTGVSVGDSVALAGMCHIEDISGTWESDISAGNATFSGLLLNSSAVSISGVGDHSAGLKIGNAAGTGNTIYQYQFLLPVVIPSGTTGLLQWNKITLPTGKHVKARFGVMDVFDLTALGLSSIAGGASMTLITGP